MNKRKEMLAFYYLVGIVMLLAVCIRFTFLIWNPLGLWFRWLQIVPIVLYAVYAFMYFKLYSDSVPVITILSTTVVHGVLCYVFTKTVAWRPLLVLVSIDILYIVVASCKASWFPFVIDGEEEDEDTFDDLIE